MKIEKIKKSGSKYKIQLDNGKIINTYEEVILENGLLFHKYINEDLHQKLLKDSEYYKIYNKVLDMINRRLRSEYEIKNYLQRQEVSENDIESILENLKKINLINDEKYAIAYTNDKINLSLDGPIKIRKYLEEQKIKEEYINNALENIDKNTIKGHIEKIIDKKIKTNTKYTAFILKQKIMIYLINLGYKKEDINEILETRQIENKNSKKEMDKVYNKLIKKNEGYELYTKLKNSLFKKGYSKEEIDDYINEKSSELFWTFFIWWT